MDNENRVLRRRGTDVLYPYHSELARQPTMEVLMLDGGGVAVEPPTEPTMVKAAPKAAPAKKKKSASEVPVAGLPVRAPAVSLGDLGDGGGDGSAVAGLTGNPELDNELTKVLGTL